MKNDLTIFACSPRKGGNTDLAAHEALEAAQRAGCSAQLVYLRNYRVMPCVGCHGCAESQDFECLFKDRDDCAMLLERIDLAGTVCFCSPIYFYHLPAGFKGLIDRSQSYYERWVANPASSPRGKKALCVLVAGRSRGRSLFQGSLLTMRYFLTPFGYDLNDLCLRGVDQKSDLENLPQLRARIRSFVEAGLK
ncbi:flavodoxin family protein [Desulfonatronovibrio hydrogenovorans]|uniref:flavodoxin family protein n=1 Tax=Desulfonatronovibrio hydrogenovorans TaxID=53245 RepID=UPI00048F1A40|nr:flavodoxin family protein [Desulfonatronovibrio hydrogenovorans]